MIVSPKRPKALILAVAAVLVAGTNAYADIGSSASAEQAAVGGTAAFHGVTMAKDPSAGGAATWKGSYHGGQIGFTYKTGSGGSVSFESIIYQNAAADARFAPKNAVGMSILEGALPKAELSDFADATLVKTVVNTVGFTTDFYRGAQYAFASKRSNEKGSGLYGLDIMPKAALAKDMSDTATCAKTGNDCP